jgi:site-specific DNA recombinase
MTVRKLPINYFRNSIYGIMKVVFYVENTLVGVSLMARKSRRGNGNESRNEISVAKCPIICAAVYLRVSMKSTLKDDSIENQRAIIENFLETKPEINVYKYYVDDGVSSYREYRPAFEEMIQDIKSGVINTVIVKDISRFGRNYIETGDYLGTIFLSIGIRFIAISEGIDSLSDDNKEYEIAIKSILNHYYSQDISVKVKSVIKQKQLSGEYIEARLPYGYKKSIVEEKTIFRPDFQKIEVVKNIFDMVLDGISCYKIAGKLNADGIKSPGNADWTVKAVSRVISNRFYTGVLETGKTENTLGGMKPIINKDQQEWIVIESHHEAVIDKETFEKAQVILKDKQDARLKGKKEKDSNGGTKKNNKKNELGSLLYCGNCGRKMKKQVWSEKVYYVCPKYSETKGEFRLKSWREDRIIHAIKREVEEQIAFLEKEISETVVRAKCMNFKDHILKFQTEIDSLLLTKDIIFDMYMESNSYEGKYLRKDLDEINDKIKDIENAINELSLQADKQKRIYDKLKLFKQFNQELNVLNNSEYNEVTNCGCIIKKVRIFENWLEVEYIQ